jgi:hypothetical protein
VTCEPLTVGPVMEVGDGVTVPEKRRSPVECAKGQLVRASRVGVRSANLLRSS